MVFSSRLHCCHRAAIQAFTSLPINALASPIGIGFGGGASGSRACRPLSPTAAWWLAARANSVMVFSRCPRTSPRRPYLRRPERVPRPCKASRDAVLRASQDLERLSHVGVWGDAPRGTGARRREPVRSKVAGRKMPARVGLRAARASLLALSSARLFWFMRPRLCGASGCRPGCGRIGLFREHGLESRRRRLVQHRVVPGCQDRVPASDLADEQRALDDLGVVHRATHVP